MHDVKIIANESTIKHEGVIHHFLPYNRFVYILEINQYVKKLKPDVVIIAGFLYPLQLILLRKVLPKQVRIIVQHHAEKPPKGLKRFLQKASKNSIEAYFFAANGLADLWIKKRLIESDKVYEIMEASSFFRQFSKEKAKEITGVSESLVYLWVGRFNQNKDPLTAVHAFSDFAKTSHAILYMIYETRELENEVMRLINNFGLQDRIKLIGKISHSEMVYWYSSADFIVSTSHYEGSGIAVCEAMSCGCIPILSNIPSFKMMTSNGRCGILFEVGEVRSLVEALKKSMETNTVQLQRSVKDHFNAKLSFSAIAKDMVEVFQKL